MNILERISAQIPPADRVFYDWQLALSAHICRVMETRGLSIAEMAELVGVSQDVLDDLLHSCADPHLSVIARISALTQTNLLTWVNSDAPVESEG